MPDKSPLSKCSMCGDGSGWIYHTEYGSVCCAECNDDAAKPKPDLAHELLDKARDEAEAANAINWRDRDSKHKPGYLERKAAEVLGPLVIHKEKKKE